MRKLVLTLSVLTALLLSGCQGQATQCKMKKYEPTWESLREYKEIPKWLRDGKFGIYTHWGPYAVHAYGENTTWYSFASEIVGLSGGKRGRIMPCSSKDYPTKAERPHWSVLSPASWEDAGLTPLRHWKKALAEALIMGTNSLS